MFSNFIKDFNSQLNIWKKGEPVYAGGKSFVTRFDCCAMEIETQKSWKPLLNTIFALSGSFGMVCTTESGDK